MIIVFEATSIAMITKGNALLSENTLVEKTYKIAT